jgi:UDP-N-acetylmuramoyl-tripeptide--D-alanyl-D-alanine ligase
MLGISIRRRLSKWTPYLLSACAFFWRRLMFRTTFIVVSGSVGKSTATAALGSILSAHSATNWTPGGENSRQVIAGTVLRTRFRHRFTVIEVAARSPGMLRRAAWMIAPDIVLMLRVLNVHSNAFPTLETMAAEKASVLSRLGKRGALILNADDPLVLAMAKLVRGTVRTFGLTPGSWMTATEVSSKWPQRLSFRATCAGDSVSVTSKLVGEHMLNSALGSLTAAVFCGVPLAEAAAALAGVEPVPGRMYPMQLANGVTVLRDDYNPTLPTLEAGLSVLRSAQASRRIVILGDVLDSGLSERPRLRHLGTRAAQSSDAVLFLGPVAKTAAKAAIAAGLPADSVWRFESLREAAEFLRLELRAGDLVLVHDWSGRHIERVILAQLGSISCWLERCPIETFCEDCSNLHLVVIENGPLRPERAG